MARSLDQTTGSLALRHMLHVDGSLGEGGGQIVRSSLALSLVTGKPFTMTNIRAGRKRPGLMAQHLTAVGAAVQICDATVEGADKGSSRLAFRPAKVKAGGYRFDVGTAGSTTLVLQTVLPALLLADGDSTLTLEGGTHNPFAPPFDFLAEAYLPLLNRMGPNVEATLDRPGFYPAGGGRMTAHIRPTRQLERLELLDRGDIVQRRVTALVANLPRHIGQRECDTIAKKTGWNESCFHVEEETRSHGPGNVVLIQLTSRHVTEVFAGFGRRGVPAERVAAGVLRQAEQYLKANVPVGPNLADQLMLPLGISAYFGQGGAFRTSPLSEHSKTHLEVLCQFLDLKTIAVEGEGGDDCVVRLE